MISANAEHQIRAENAKITPQNTYAFVRRCSGCGKHKEIQGSKFVGGKMICKTCQK